MDQYICNKCYCTQDNMGYPFELTQCGHIFCYNCIKEVKNKCSECKSTGIRSMPLKKSVVSTLSKLSPLSNSLASIKSLIIFQNEQRNIILECYHQLDDKYQMLKYRYINAIQHEKKIISEYCNLKKYVESQRKKLMFMKINSISQKTVYITPCLMCEEDIAIQTSSDQYISNKIYDINISSSKLYKS